MPPPFVGDAVASVLGQTFADFELLVTDDGSTDGTAAAVRRAAGADPRVRLVSRPNTGYVPALNEMLATAAGPLVARMDADDVCLPGRFAAQVAYLSDHPDCVLIGTGVEQMDGDGVVIGPMADVRCGHGAINADLLRRGWPIVHPTVMMRADAVRQVGGYDPALCPNEDHDLFLRLGEVGRLENLPEVLLRYRKHAASESTLKRARTADLVTRIIVDACRRRGVPVPPEATAAVPPVRSIADQERGWAWQAVKHGHRTAARKYASRTVRRKPFSLDSWRLLRSALRGR